MQDFYDIQTKITDFLNNIQKQDNFTKTYGKLSTNDALFCASDIIRNKAFFKSIEKAIFDLNKKDLVLVDAGSGTGILGFFALFLGASKCIFIEKNEISLEISKNLARHLGFYEKCVFLLGDASEIKIKENYDLIISETIVTAFLEEDFPIIIKNLKKENVKIIPERFVFYFELFSEIGELIEKNEMEIICTEIQGKINLDFKNEVKNVKITTKVFLYDDVFLSSGDCISFVNERRVEI